MCDNVRYYRSKNRRAEKQSNQGQNIERVREQENDCSAFLKNTL
jgi:hypothetical protein